MISLLFHLSYSSNILQRVAPLFNGNNITFVSKKEVQLSYTKYPLFLSNSKFSANMLNIHNTIFTRSAAKIVKGSFHQLNIKGCVFSNSKSPLESNSGIVYQNIITEPLVLTTKDAGVSISSSLFKDLTSSKENRGGAITITRISASIARCSFENCNSINGGAIYATESMIELRFVGYHGCSASNNGGAFYLDNSKVDIEMSEFTKCKANSLGAVFYGNYSTIILNKMTLYQNTAKTAAVYLISSAFEGIEGFFSNNTATEECAGLYLKDSYATLSVVHFGMNFIKKDVETPICGSGNSSVSFLEYSCLPANYKLPVHHTGNLTYLDQCPLLEQSILDIQESAFLDINVVNSVYSSRFVYALIAIIVVPILIAFFLPKLL